MSAHATRTNIFGAGISVIAIHRSVNAAQCFAAIYGAKVAVIALALIKTI